MPRPQSPFGVSSGMTNLQTASQRIDTIVNNAKQMAAWMEKRRATIKRVLPRCDDLEMAHRTEELVDKMDFLNKNKAHFTWAVDVVQYDTERINAQIERLQMRIRAVREEIDRRDNRIATGTMHISPGRLDFKHLIDEARKDPAMAAVTYEGIPAYANEQQEMCKSLVEISETVAILESNLESLFTIFHKDIKPFVIIHVDGRINTINDIVQGRLADLENMTDSVLEPFKAIDASEVEDLRAKLDTYNDAKRLYEQNIDATKVDGEEEIKASTAKHKTLIMEKDQQILDLETESQRNEGSYHR
ncbi:hypothetical protein MMC34_005538 [Xylographa carneopallida]|nr:hypothetical protein [Xylographa carneopallida]